MRSAGVDSPSIDADSGVLLREYVWLEDRPLTVIEGGQVFALHRDHIDRPVAATDAARTVVWSATWLPCRAGSTR